MRACACVKKKNVGVGREKRKAYYSRKTGGVFEKYIFRSPVTAAEGNCRLNDEKPWNESAPELIWGCWKLETWRFADFD